MYSTAPVGWYFLLDQEQYRPLLQKRPPEPENIVCIGCDISHRKSQKLSSSSRLSLKTVEPQDVNRNLSETLKHCSGTLGFHRGWDVDNSCPKSLEYQCWAQKECVYYMKFLLFQYKITNSYVSEKSVNIIYYLFRFYWIVADNVLFNIWLYNSLRKK